ncbi:GroES-like protein [Epithele typhae]|uniref:GroES-like protein n=1 Tax=Epithele typhae TaxID=378194 RepID=UPI002007FABC|nr:GroES-like protein [Epithele typhae]KAH9917142.1 GroES-like protein [Epithele typhae]
MAVPAAQKALLIPAKFAPCVVGTIAVSQPKLGELLVRIDATALNPIDWKIRVYGVLAETFPAVTGYDAAGVVVALGEGVTSFAVGDRVMVQGWFDAESKSVHGTFVQYFDLPARLAFKIPESISIEAAATIPSGISTAAFPLYHPDIPASAKLKAPWTAEGAGAYSGKPFFVLGGSSCVGQFVIQLARLSGFAPIITTSSLHHTDYLQSLGATHVLDRRLPHETLIASAREIAGGKPFDVVYDAISVTDTLALGYALTAPGGDFVIVLDLEPVPGRDDATGKKVHMAHGLFMTPVNHGVGASLLDALPKLLESGAIKPSRHEILPGGLAGIIDGLRRMENDEVSGVKLVVRPQETV